MVGGSASYGTDMSSFLLTYVEQGYKVRPGDRRIIDSIANTTVTYCNSSETDYCIIQYVPCVRHANKPDIALRLDLSFDLPVISAGGDGKPAERTDMVPARQSSEALREVAAAEVLTR